MRLKSSFLCDSAYCATVDTKFTRDFLHSHLIMILFDDLRFLILGEYHLHGLRDFGSCAIIERAVDNGSGIRLSSSRPSSFPSKNLLKLFCLDTVEEDHGVLT